MGRKGCGEGEGGVVCEEGVVECVGGKGFVGGAEVCVGEGGLVEGGSLCERCFFAFMLCLFGK